MKILKTLQDGSDRVFHRVECEYGTCILLRETLRYRFEQFLKVAQILKGLAPEIYKVNREKLEILMEDLGDESLYNHIHRNGDYGVYQDIIKVLKQIHSLPCENLPHFDEEHYRFEIDYFLQFNPHLDYLQDFLMKNAELLSSLKDRTFMHRDFQSRNIFLTPSGIRVIDFQTAHCGHSYYDLASLLWDPYVSLPDDIREDSARLYGVEDYTLLKRFAIQRLSQALAAYRKLSGRKKFFERFIEPAWKELSKLIEEFRK